MLTRKGSFHANILTVNSNPSIPNIFRFQKREYENESNFNICFLIPTGIGCEIGGHAGDATPVLRFISDQCNTVVTHPNVVNASDINEMPQNALYVEGFHLTNFIMGNIGLMRKRKNRILVLSETGNVTDKIQCLTVNAINAARATLGVDITVLKLESEIYMQALLESNKATGKVTISQSLIQLLEKRIDEFDVIAISSPVKVPEDIHEAYSRSNGSMVNPWGGVESMLTHFISSKFNKIAAHAPVLDDESILVKNFGIVDPRIAPEIVSSTFFHSVLKGLHQSPKIVDRNDGLTIKDISAIVVPDGVLGLPIIAALHHGIKVVAVTNKNTMNNDLSLLPWRKGQFFQCRDYLEACGILSCIKTGTSIESTKRPLQPFLGQSLFAEPSTPLGQQPSIQ